MSKTLRLLVCVCALVLGVAVLAGCGSSKKSSSSGGTSGASASSATSTGAGATTDKKVASLVPPAIKKKGTLTAAADATYAPNEFIAPDGHTIKGMDVDLLNALAKVMGLKAQMKNATFDSIIPGLASKKYDLGLSSFTDTKEREKTVDFVTYFTAGTSFYVKAQGGPNITTLADLCGRKVAAEKGTTQADDIAKQAKKCKAAGDPAPKGLIFPDQNGVNLALSSGRADVGMADSPVVDYQVKKSNGTFKTTGQPYATAPYGIAVPKGTGMTKPVLAALKVLIKNGQYMAILKKWGIQSGALTNPKINGATS